MSGIEDILRQVMASHDQEAPTAAELFRALEATPGPPGRRGKWSGVFVPLAAAGAVGAVVAASLAIGAVLRGNAGPAGPGPAAQSHPSPAPLRPVALRPAALSQVPRYFALLTGPVQARAAVVRSTITGHVLATVTPPRPYRIFTWVTAAADDRTFVLAAQRYWPIASGQAGLPAQNRDNTTPTVFFTLAFDPATRTAKLVRLAVPGTIPSAQLAGMTVSPDGTRLALDLRQSIQIVTLATGAIRSWAWQGGGWIGNWKPLGQVFSWTADGTMLEFQQWDDGAGGGPAYIRLLDTTAPGTSLASAKIVLTFPNFGAFGLNTLLTPDGTRIVTATPQGITEFSARTGQPILSEDQFQAGWQEVLWASPGGQALVVSDPRGKQTPYGRGNILGVLTGNTFTAIPYGTYQSAQIAW